MERGIQTHSHREEEEGHDMGLASHRASKVTQDDGKAWDTEDAGRCQSPP